MTIKGTTIRRTTVAPIPAEAGLRAAANGCSRRRFIRITAAAAAAALLPGGTSLRAATVAYDADRQLRIWQGVALGADAMLQIHHPDAAAADELIDRCLTEVARLERVFSLYREDSALSHLNRTGGIDGPPLEFVDLMGEAEGFSRLTAGAFDATVQPLWDLYANHFSKPDADPFGPGRSALEATLERVGHDAIELDPRRIAFTKPGMAVTLNGIAQGYITDRIVELLRDAGLAHALVDMGEIRAIGGRPSGEPWTVGLKDPIITEQIAERIMIENQAVATSGGYGTLLDPAGRFNHIFDPKSGETSWRYLSVSVIAPTATTADALSTAFSLMPLAQTRRVVDQLGISAHFALPDGSRLQQGV